MSSNSKRITFIPPSNILTGKELQKEAPLIGGMLAALCLPDTVTLTEAASRSKFAVIVVEHVFL